MTLGYPVVACQRAFPVAKVDRHVTEKPSLLSIWGQAVSFLLAGSWQGKERWAKRPRTKRKTNEDINHLIEILKGLLEDVHQRIVIYLQEFIDRNKERRY